MSVYVQFDKISKIFDDYKYFNIVTFPKSDSAFCSRAMLNNEPNPKKIPNTAMVLYLTFFLKGNNIFFGECRKLLFV